jgi:polyisoprenoid-binding protein YceI
MTDEIRKGQMTSRDSARSRRGPLGLVIVAALVAAVAVGAYGVWYLFLQGPGPAAVADATLPPVPSTAASSSSPVASGDVSGTWKVDTSIGSFSDFSGSFVGYRVQEQLATLGANTAVGRTPNVSGTMTIDGTRVTAATITADLTTLQSDDQRRDGQLGRQGIQTNQFPNATFTLTSPIDLGSVPKDGQEITVTAKGQLELHGVKKDVEVALKARLSGSVIQVSGSLPIVWTDYGIQKPQSFIVLTIADQGTMELQLFFTRS